MAFSSIPPPPPPPPQTAAASPAPETLPLRDIPGPVYGPLTGTLASIKDRLDFFWFQGEREFWASRIRKHKSTVFRTHVPPSPPAYRRNPVVMLLDQNSFPILFDNSKVDKKDTLLANYVPNIAFYGGFRPCVYLDPTEERHGKHKSFIMQVLKSSASSWIPETQSATEAALDQFDAALLKDSAASSSVSISSQTPSVALRTLVRSLLGTDPSGISPTDFSIWLAPQLLPITTVGLPHLLEELLLHNIRLPFFLVSFFYNRLLRFFRQNASTLLDTAVRDFGIEREDALHGIVFFTGFNAFGGLNILLPQIVSYVGQAPAEVQAAMAAEVRAAVEEVGGGKMTAAAVAKMDLVRSAVYETLRMSPPVPYQYGVAKEDVEIESHEARFRIKKGEIVGGCQPFACRDAAVFGADAEEFVASRFVGKEGERLLRHVLWGNGAATDTPTTANKLCAANSLVPLISTVFLATFFLRYDAFTADASQNLLSLRPRSPPSPA